MRPEIFKARNRVYAIPVGLLRSYSHSDDLKESYGHSCFVSMGFPYRYLTPDTPIIAHL